MRDFARHLCVPFVAIAAASALTACGRTDGLPGLSCVQSSTWQTVDDFAPLANSINSGVGATADSNGKIYTIGADADSGGNTHWIVRMSPDRGGTWSTVDDYQLNSANSTYPASITADFSGGVYAVGNPYDASSTSHWAVRRSTDGGNIWNTVDDVVGAQATAAVFRPSVGLNVFGELQSGSSPWTSRNSSDRGSSWTNGDSFSLSTNGALAVSAAVDLAGNLYAAGYATDAGSLSHWIVRKSTNGGTTWTASDDFQLAATASSNASSIAVDSAGNLFAVGNGVDASSNQFWIVRRSGDGGASWTTIRQVQQNGHASGASAIGFDHLGAVWVGGQASDSSGKSQWLVETSSDGGQNWTTSDSFQYTGTAGAGLSGQALAFAFTATGDLYVTGQVTINTTGNPARWITRKLGCN